jgi:hypothetical protein
MKLKPNGIAAKPAHPRKPGRRQIAGTKTKPWRGFAPELCGVMKGPSDLSSREGLAGG